MSDSTETPLQMAERHVVEGQARIARQEALIAQLGRDGHDRMLPEADRLLKNLRVQQTMEEEHLAQLLAKDASGNQPI